MICIVDSFAATGVRACGIEESPMRAPQQERATVSGSCEGSRVTLVRGVDSAKNRSTFERPVAVCRLLELDLILIVFAMDRILYLSFEFYYNPL